MSQKVTIIKRTEPKPLSWKLRTDIETSLILSNCLKVQYDRHDLTKAAERILQVLDEKYGIKLDYMDQWVCDWKADKKQEDD